MPKKDEHVPSHDQNGRSFLAEEVQAQRRNITELVGAVAGLQALVRELVEDGREERKSAKEYRQDIREQLYAQRAEQQQLNMSLTSVQVDMGKVAKTLGEHETERVEQRGAWKLATISARVAWALFGIVSAAAIGLFTWIIKFAPTAHPPTLPHP